MTTKAKIKIDDNTSLRDELEALYREKTRHRLLLWALETARHIFDMLGYDCTSDEVLQNAFSVSTSWQRGEAGVADIRRAGFLVHQSAKAGGDVCIQAAMRAAGHAVSTGHMREHAMVAADYAIKAINLRFPDDREAVTRERQRQIAALC